jgi:hypothetical protein
LVDIAVDMVENRVECAHEQLRWGKPDREIAGFLPVLYILILPGLFGNRWNADKVPGDIYLNFSHRTNGQGCILRKPEAFDGAIAKRH